MESAFVGVVLTAVGHLAVLNVVLSASVALDDANDAEEENEEGKGEDHADEPASSGDSIVVLRCHNDV